MTGPTFAGWGSLPHDTRQRKFSGPTKWVNDLGNNKPTTEALGSSVSDGLVKVGQEVNFSKERLSGRLPNQSSASVKGKKEIARNKVTKWNVKEDAGNIGNSVFKNSLKWSSLNSIGDGCPANDQFQFSAAV